MSAQLNGARTDQAFSFLEPVGAAPVHGDVRDADVTRPRHTHAVVARFDHRVVAPIDGKV